MVLKSGRDEMNYIQNTKGILYRYEKKKRDLTSESGVQVAAWSSCNNFRPLRVEKA
tara:strand:- start:2567 stop:2734 length:168 start_codon:yes stop_codon:yes gene_type:complete